MSDNNSIDTLINAAAAVDELDNLSDISVMTMLASTSLPNWIIRMWKDKIMRLLLEGFGIRGEGFDVDYDFTLVSDGELRPDVRTWVSSVTTLLIDMRAMFSSILDDYEEIDGEL